MGDFLSSFCKGFFPFFFIFAVIGMAIRIRRRQWTGFDTLLISIFLFYEILTACLPWLFYGKWTISTRYLVIGLPLYFPFAAIGLQAICQAGAGQSSIRILKIAICCLLLGVMMYKTYSPIFKWHQSVKKQTERTITFTASHWIRNNWHSQKHTPLDQYRCDQYQSGKRPLIQSKWQRIGYFSGGQLLPEFLQGTAVKADYIVTSDQSLPPDYGQAHHFSVNRRQVFIYALKKTKR